MNHTHEQLQQAAIENAMDTLTTVFDNVQIFCSTMLPDDERTRVAVSSEGNFYARYGQIKEWLLAHEESMRNISIDAKLQN